LSFGHYKAQPRPEGGSSLGVRVGGDARSEIPSDPIGLVKCRHTSLKEHLAGLTGRLTASTAFRPFVFAPLSCAPDTRRQSSGTSNFVKLGQIEKIERLVLIVAATKLFKFEKQSNLPNDFDIRRELCGPWLTVRL
jgi:hypothetical protein